MGKINPKIIELLKKLKKRIENKYHIKRMILFGSQVTGKARSDSDIDLIIVTSKKEERIVTKLLDEWHFKQNIDYPVDFIDYTDAEFNRLAKRITLVSQALKTGVEI